MSELETPAALYLARISPRVGSVPSLLLMGGRDLAEFEKAEGGCRNAGTCFRRSRLIIGINGGY